MNAKNHYPSVTVAGRIVRVNRHLLGLEYGDPTHACHKCDNPWCVNVDHLFKGNGRLNARDKQQKGRGKDPAGLNSATTPEQDAVRGYSQQDILKHSV
jgi:deoxycytidylate deaminase